MKILLVGHGYVGAYLRPVLTQTGLDVSVCDQNVERLAGVPNAMRCRYQELTISDLADFSAILWFAGHSSVPMSLRDPTAPSPIIASIFFTLPAANSSTPA
ncbi:MAG TPA: hypothetical protein VIF39_08325 [Hyphomicrobium sp.]|jgi:nucleoside-diphosphate-sugar epimerase